MLTRSADMPGLAEDDASLYGACGARLVYRRGGRRADGTA